MASNFTELPPTADEGEGYLTPGYWVGSGACERQTDAEKSVIEARAAGKVQVFDVIQDKNADYSFDDWALCLIDKKWWLISTSGCSCPSPTETWRVEIGPATLKEIRAHVEGGHYEGYTLPVKQKADFTDMLDRAEKESV